MAVRLHTLIGLVPDEERVANSSDSVLVHEPTIGAIGRSKGSLFAIVTARGGSARAREATQLVATEIDHAYYYDESAGIPICLEKAIRNANKRLIHRREAHAVPPGGIGIVVAIIRERELYVATAGDGDAFLARQATFLTLPDAKRGSGLPTSGEVEVDVWRGELLVGDTLLLASREATERLGTDELRQAVTTLHPDSAVQHLHNRLVAEGGPTSDALLVVEATEVAATKVERALVPVRPNETLAGAPDSSPIPLADTVAAGATAVQGRARSAGAAGRAAIVETGALLLGLIPRRRGYRRVTPLSDRQLARQRAGVVALIALFLIGAVGVANWAAGRPPTAPPFQQVNQGEAALQAARDQLALVFGSGSDLILADPQKALVDLQAAWAKLDEAERYGIQAGSMKPIRDQVAAGLDRLYNTTQTGATLLVNLTKLSPNANLSELVRGPDGAAYTIDHSTHAVIRIDLSKKVALVVAKQGDGAGRGLGDPWILTVGGPDVVILDHNGALWRWRPADRNGHGTLAQIHVGGNVTWGNDILDIGTYPFNPQLSDGLYNLYVVDPSSKQILRYSPAADGSGYPSNPTNYLATAGDVSAIEQLFIDGDIYALTSGSVLRLVNGKQDDTFAPQALPDASDLRPGHDFRVMSADAARRDGQVFAWDAANQRIVAYDKATGDYAGQYTAASGTPALADLRGMFVVAGTKGTPDTIVWAAGARIYATVLRAYTPPAAGATPTPRPSPSPKKTPKPTKKPARSPTPPPG